MQASGPGKVLLTGGYLILDDNYSGLVLGVSARLHASLYPLPKSSSPSIILLAPQMTPNPTVYQIHSPASNSFALKKSQGQSNKFVEITINHTLTVLSGLLSDFETRLASGFLLYVHGDSQFYTADAPEKGTEEKMPSVTSTKTGLGSSAALVSSVVAAFFAQFNLLASHNHLAHHLAQFCHCSAQGKVGSGFDVAAAFYGSQRYTRFSPKRIEALLQEASQQPVPHSRLLTVLNTEPWIKHIPFSLPQGLHLLLGDVQGGSETPGMVKKVLEWRKQQAAAANKLWDDLARLNFEVETGLRELGQLEKKDPAGYRGCLELAHKTVPTSWGSLAAQPALKVLIQLQQSFLRVRSLLSHMGKVAGTEIEPQSQSQLLNLTMGLPGVVFAGVPGAGGFDAIFAIVVSPPNTDPAAIVEETWAKHKVKRLRLDADSASTAGLRVGPVAQPPSFLSSYFTLAKL